MLAELRIANFRGYNEEQGMEFARPGDDRLGLTILVGPNNTGKTTPLDAVRRLCDGQTTVVFDEDDLHDGLSPLLTLRMEIEGISATIQLEGRVDSSYLSKKILDSQGNPTDVTPSTTFVKSIPARRPWQAGLNYRTRKSSRDFEREEKTSESSQNRNADLAQALLEILNSTDKAAFDTLIRGIVPNLSDWTISNSNGSDLLKYKTKSGKKHSINLLGMGMSSIFRVGFTLFKSVAGDCILLDEPELSLHPQSQRRLSRLLTKMSKDRQIVVATHSPHFIRWSDLQNGAKVFRVNQNDMGWSEIRSLSDETVRQLEGVVTSDFKNRKIYDVLAKEAFFSDGIIFTEGQEDVHYIENYVEHESLSPLPLFGYGSGGASHIGRWLKFADDLGIKAVGLFDNDERKAAAKLCWVYRKNKRIMVTCIPRNDIRDKYLRDGKCAQTGKCNETQSIVKEGVFNRDGNIHTSIKPRFDRLLNKISNHISNI